MELSGFADFTWTEIAPYSCSINEFFKVFPVSLAKLQPEINIRVPQGDRLFVLDGHTVIKDLNSGSYRLGASDFPELFLIQAAPVQQDEIKADFVFLKMDYYEQVTFDLTETLADAHGNEADLALRYRLGLTDPVKLLNELYYRTDSTKAILSHPEILVEFLVPRLLQQWAVGKNLGEPDSLSAAQTWQDMLKQFLAPLGLEVLFDEIQVQAFRPVQSPEVSAVPVLEPEPNALGAEPVAEPITEPVTEKVEPVVASAAENIAELTSESVIEPATELTMESSDEPAVEPALLAEPEATSLAPAPMNSMQTFSAPVSESASFATSVDSNPTPDVEPVVAPVVQPAPTVVTEPMYHVGMPGTQPMGPYPLSKLQRDAAAGLFGANMLVWTPGMADWKPVAQVPEIAQYLPRI